MSSVCRTKPSCPAPSTGYNICIENRTDIEQVYQFGLVPDNGVLSELVISQTVTVPRNSNICYKITSPIGEPVAFTTPFTTGIAGIFACSVHLTTGSVVGIGTGDIPEVTIVNTLDCSPCPCDCEFSCVPEKSSCESVSGPGFGLGFGLSKKLVSKKLAKLCSDNPYETTSDTGGWIFSGN